MDSDIPPEESEQYQHRQAAAFKSPSQKPSKIPRLVSSPAKAKPASKVSSILVTPETSSRDMRLVQLFFRLRTPLRQSQGAARTGTPNKRKLMSSKRRSDAFSSWTSRFVVVNLFASFYISVLNWFFKPLICLLL